MRKHSVVRVTALILAALCLSFPVQASGLSKQKASPLYNKGEIYTRTVTSDVAMGIGAVNGWVLSVDSTSPTGMRWGSVGTGGGSGTVTNSGTLTSNAVIIGAGTTVVQAITADTATTHALFSTATSPAFRNIVTSDIASGVFGENFGGTGKSTYTKGDLLVGATGATLVKFPVGANGTILSADSSQTNGVVWITPPAGGAGTPGNPSSSVQYNNSGSFAGAALISTDGTRLSIGPGTSTAISLDVAGSSRNVPFQLTDGSSIAIDASRSNFFWVQLTGAPRTLANPTNGVFGQKIVVMVSQDGTGSRKMGFGTSYAFGSDVPSYDATTTAGMFDFIGMIRSVNSWDVVSVAKGYR